MRTRLIGGAVGLVAGYMLGMILGFILFDPNADLWAFLGGVLGLLGLALGLFNVVSRRLVDITLAIIGFYLGSILGILLFGKPALDDLLEITRTPAISIALGGALVGFILGTKFKAVVAIDRLVLSIIVGFVSGYLLGVVCHLAPYQSMVGWSPTIIVACMVCYATLEVINRKGIQNTTHA